MKDIGANILTDSTDTAFLMAMDRLVNKGTVKLSPTDIGVGMQDLLDLDHVISNTKVGTLVRKFFGNVRSRSAPNGATLYQINRPMVDDILDRYQVEPQVRVVEIARQKKRRVVHVDQIFKERVLGGLDGWTGVLQVKRRVGRPTHELLPALEELVREGKAESDPPIETQRPSDDLTTALRPRPGLVGRWPHGDRIQLG